MAVPADPWQRQFRRPVRRPAAPRPRITVPPDPWQRPYLPRPAAPPPAGGFPPFGYPPTYLEPPGGAYVPDGGQAEPPPRPIPAFNFNTDPGYMAALAAEQAGRGGIEAWLKQRRAEELINFGDPDWAAQSGFALDPQAAEAARSLTKSGNSIIAQLTKAREGQRTSLINRLAARGILFSGDLGYGERENEAAFGRARYGAQQSVLGSLRGYQDQATAQQQALRQSVIDSLQTAYQNYLGNPWLYSGVG